MAWAVRVRVSVRVRVGVWVRFGSTNLGVRDEDEAGHVHEHADELEAQQLRILVRRVGEPVVGYG